MAMLEVRNIQTFYGRIHALKGISLTVEEGEIVTLIGSNGAGKTTTLNTICGIRRAAQGQVVLNGEDITHLKPHDIVARGIGQSPEGRKIFARLTVRENLELGAYSRHDSDGIQKDMEYVFSLFPRLKEREKQAGGTLSGGEQQMLAIGRALMTRPKILLLDEPSMGLAPMLVQEIFKIITYLNQEEKTTILLVEQNAQMAFKVAHRGYVLQTGKVVMSDDCTTLAANEDVRAAYLGGH
ncbi:MAG: ABC transporter ATP-binding protein [Anaerolineae bacterium]|jgi:branched-chain amino acid transport system ATP-binding protein|nr:ABC transporter ATP-binding protein [Anaerolineae bacterium]